MRFFAFSLLSVLSALCLSPGAAVADEIFVLDTDQSNSSYRFVQRFDAGSGVLIQSITLPAFTNSGLCFGPDGDVFAGSTGFGQIVRLDAQNNFAASNFTNAPAAFGVGLTFGPDGNLYQVTRDNNAVRRFNGATGALLGNFVAPGEGGVSFGGGIVFGPDGNLYVTSIGNGTVARFSGVTGAFLGTFVSGLSSPQDLRFGPDGNLYIADANAQQISRFNGITGASLGTFANTSANGQGVPTGLDFAPNGDLFTVGNASGFGSLRATVQRYNAGTGTFGGTVVAPSAGGMRNASQLLYRSVAVVPESGTGIFGVTGLLTLGSMVIRRRKLAVAATLR